MWNSTIWCLPYWLALFWSIFVCYLLPRPFLPFKVELFTLYHCTMEVCDLFNFGGTLNQDPVLSLRRDWTHDFWVVLALLGAIIGISKLDQICILKWTWTYRRQEQNIIIWLWNVLNRLMKPLFEKSHWGREATGGKSILLLLPHCGCHVTSQLLSRVSPWWRNKSLRTINHSKSFFP